MSRFKKLTALLLAAVIAFSFAACGKNKDKEDGKSEDVKTIAETSDLILPYSREDGVNPFAATSLVNEVIMPLMYDSLFEMDETYKPQPSLASASTVTGKIVTVTIDNTRTFTDGSRISANDIVYSFEKAQESPYYGSALEKFRYARARGDDTVIFMLEENNAYAAADLTFPIVESGTANDEESVPIGTGRYYYQPTDNGENGGILKDSGLHEEKTKAKQIFLANMTGSDSLLYSLAIGNINATFDDLSKGSLDRVSVSKEPVPLNNMEVVQIRGAVADAPVRRYISALLDRNSLVSSGMDGYGEAASLPFNPKWYVCKDITQKDKVDTDKAKEAIKNAFKDKETISIVTNKDNAFKVNMAEELASQLKSLGIQTEVEQLSTQDYQTAVNTVSYDICIAEYRLTNDMDVSSFLQGDVLEAYKDMLDETGSPEEFIKAFNKEMPFIVIGFRDGVLAYSRYLETDAKVLPGNPYANVYEWTVRS